MLIAEDIVYAYGKKQVLQGAGFKADVGQCVGIVGANGCGKTTLLGILSGVRKSQGGTLNICGKDAFKNPKVFGNYVGYVPQENALIDELSVMDNLRLWYGSKKRIFEAMEHGFLSVLDVADFLQMPAGKLSGGQKKRVNIACAFAAEPSILIMDEPGAALDIVCKDEIQKYLKIYLKHRGTIVLATHDTEELNLCQKLYVMNDGKLREVDSNLRGPLLVREIENGGTRR